MYASELYAKARGTQCVGPDECHWCAAPCERLVPHDEPPPQPYVKRVGSRTCRRPNGGYVCRGCWHWRQPSITVRYLSGRVRDRRKPCDHSWLILEDGAWGIDRDAPSDCERILRFLLAPRMPFSLMIHAGEPLLLQYGLTNTYGEARNDTPLCFTSGTIPCEYTIYDLERSLRYPEVGATSPGVQILLGEFGKPESLQEAEKKKLRGGQARKEEEASSYLQKVIVSHLSGWPSLSLG